jgi:DMSO/TMAO reductase YedYZ molybdopterin-dependent catalytic subunit
VDLVLGLLLLAALGTGVGANAVGVHWPLNLIQLHAAAALAILLVAPWKYAVIRRGLRRPGRRRSVKGLSLALAGLVVVALGSGLLHSTGHAETLGAVTLMQVHVGAAIGAAAVAVAHVAAHRLRPRRADADRRALLRLAVLGACAAAATAAWDGGAAAARRFTGSVPKAEPEVTSWLDDGVQTVDAGRWALRVGPAVFDLPALLALPHERVPAVLDCTSGWCSRQDWDGVRLDVLLAAAGVPVAGLRSVAVRSVTGYARWFGATTLDRVWLATGVGGEPLPYGNGYPARIVAPGRRGFWWVKWVHSVEASARPAWAQSVFPLS